MKAYAVKLKTSKKEFELLMEKIIARADEGETRMGSKGPGYTDTTIEKLIEEGYDVICVRTETKAGPIFETIISWSTAEEGKEGKFIGLTDKELFEDAMSRTLNMPLFASAIQFPNEDNERISAGIEEFLEMIGENNCDVIPTKVGTVINIKPNSDEEDEEAEDSVEEDVTEETSTTDDDFPVDGRGEGL